MDMRPFWEKLRVIFVETHRDNIVESLKKEDAIYRGNEPECWACGHPIHKSHRSRRLDGQKIHIKCFKKMKMIAKQKVVINGA